MTNNTQRNQSNISKELDQESDKTVVGGLGVLIGTVVLLFAIFCSVKMYHVFTTPESPHTVFATICGLPFTLMLYLLSYKCFQLKHAEFVPVYDNAQDEPTDVEIRLPDAKNNSVIETLFNTLLFLLKLVITLLFGGLLVFIIKDFTLDKTPLLLTVLVVLGMTHFSTFKRLQFMNENQLMKFIATYRKYLFLLMVIPLVVQMLNHWFGGLFW